MSFYIGKGAKTTKSFEEKEFLMIEERQKRKFKSSLNGLYFEIFWTYQIHGDVFVNFR